MELTAKKKQQTLVVDLGDMKSPWREWCAANDMTPSQGVRRLLADAMKENRRGEGTPVIRQSKSVRSGQRKRFEISLSLGEYDAMADMAAKEGTTVSKLFASIIRLLTTGRQQFSRKEIEALSTSNRSMIAIGRNVNQIARRMNERADKDELTLAQIEYVANEIAEHRKLVRELLDANSLRWRL